MKFLDKIQKFRVEVLKEAEQPPLPPGAEENPTPQEVQAQQPQAEQPQESQPQQSQSKLTPEGEVMLIRLLKKAFVITPRTEDIETISDLDDINENNGRESLQKIINLIKKYTDDIDVD